MSSFNKNEWMIQTQILARGIKNKNVLYAFQQVDRAMFVPDKFIESAYDDHPLPIGVGQTISQPYIVAYMTQLIDPHDNETVLEIGTGSGYQTAILANIFKEVYTVERIGVLSEEAKKILQKFKFKNIHYRVGDGYEGWPEFQPYDKIIVTAAPPEIPDQLAKQLKIGGKMVIPVGKSGNVQHLCLVERQENRFETQFADLVAFVPMVKGME